MSFFSAPTNRPTTIEPAISEEADKALRPWVIIGLPASMACGFLAPLGVIFLGLYFPTNPFIVGQHSPLSMLSYFVWMLPAYYVFTNVYALRLDFGRKYVAEHKWKEADAALGSTDSMILKFFDKTGEAHYLWAMALDGLGKRVAAEKAREFIRKNRAKSEYAAKLGSASVIATVSASELRKRDTTASSDTSAGTTGNLKKTKRRRF